MLWEMAPHHAYMGSVNWIQWLLETKGGHEVEIESGYEVDLEGVRERREVNMTKTR